jgi:hypothetical protein
MPAQCISHHKAGVCTTPAFGQDCWLLLLLLLLAQSQLLLVHVVLAQF